MLMVLGEKGRGKKGRGLVSLAMLCLAVTSTHVAYGLAGGAIAQGFETDSTNISTGAILSLKSKGSNIVEPAVITNDANLIGVAADKPLIELSSDGKNSVQVAVSGSTQTLVSDINGSVGVGDKVTISPISGIGMKATGSSEIIGVAQSSLSSVPTVKQLVKDKTGKDITINIGLLPIAVNVSYYSTADQGSLSNFVPSFLQSLADNLSGKQVSPLRVLLGALALLLGIITVMVMLSASIKSGVISVGRNPLAAGQLRKELVDIAFVAFGVLIMTVVVEYIILIS